MTKWLLAGDVHGNGHHTRQVFAHAQDLGAERIVQLGDFGYGFSRHPITGECTFALGVSRMVDKFGIPMYFLGGNHENWDMLDALSDKKDEEDDGTIGVAVGVYYIPRATMFLVEDTKILCCGGAASVDWAYRIHRQKDTGNKSWWPQEKITKGDVLKCKFLGPADILLTHDFPWECEVVDRHLEPVWGIEAEYNTRANRRRVSEILANCGAKRVFHGHLHRFYTEEIVVNGQKVVVQGLDCDGRPLHMNTWLLEIGN